MKFRTEKKAFDNLSSFVVECFLGRKYSRRLRSHTRRCSNWVSRLHAELGIIIDRIRRRCWFVYFTLKALTRGAFLGTSKFCFFTFHGAKKIFSSTLQRGKQALEKYRLINNALMFPSFNRLGNHWHSTGLLSFSLADWLISSCVTKQISNSHSERLFSSFDALSSGKLFNKLIWSEEKSQSHDINSAKLTWIPTPFPFSLSPLHTSSSSCWRFFGENKQKIRKWKSVCSSETEGNLETGGRARECFIFIRNLSFVYFSLIVQRLKMGREKASSRASWDDKASLSRNGNKPWASQTLEIENFSQPFMLDIEKGKISITPRHQQSTSFGRK